MIKLYFKQAWELLRQNHLFSLLYIVGTGLAISLTMVMAVIYYVRLAPLYPEYDRSRTLYMGYLQVQQTFDGGGWRWQSGSFSHHAVTEWLRPLEGVAVASGYWLDSPGSNYIQLPDGRGEYSPVTLFTDPDFFRMYAFRFTDGAAFTEDDFRGAMRRVVITDGLARRLFGADTGVVGRTFLMNYRTYTVCGVVRAASQLMEQSYAEVYVPYSVNPSLLEITANNCDDMGNLSVTLVARDAEAMDHIRRAIDEHVQRFNTSHAEENLTLSIEKGPRSHLQSVLEGTAGSEGDVSMALRRLGLIVLVLLLVPALNLSGLIASRMEARLPEMGVRKTFGAWRSTLLNMVLWENLLLTLLGGLLGLVVAWVCLYVGREWVFTILDSYATRVTGEATYVSGEMLFAPVVFLCALTLCLILNILSAMIPAWWSLRHPIVQSLYEKR